MQKSHGLFAALLLSLLAVPAIAVSPQSWVLVKTEDSGNKFYLNADTVTRKGAIVSFTTISVLAQPDSNGAAAVGLRVDGNCTHNQIRYVYAMTYDSQFNILFEEKRDRKWKKVSPETAGYAALRKACEKRTR